MPTNLTPAEIAEGLRIELEATPGPWQQAWGRTSEAVISENRKYDSVEQVRYGGSPVVDCDTDPYCGSTERENDANAAFIVWCRNNIGTALRELAALRAYREAVQDATLSYDDPRRASQPPQAEWGLELFHDIEEADRVFRAAMRPGADMSDLNIGLDIEGPVITEWGATSRHFVVEWDGERIEFQRGADGRWRNIGQPKRIDDDPETLVRGH